MIEIMLSHLSGRSVLRFGKLMGYAVDTPESSEYARLSVVAVRGMGCGNTWVIDSPILESIH